MSSLRGGWLNSYHWQVEWPSIPPGDQEAFQSAERLLREPVRQVTLDRVSGVAVLSLDQTYYIKTFAGRRSRIKHWLGISRYQRESRNLQYFKETGLATPQLVACGHRSTLGVFRQAVLVTLEVENASDLGEVLKQGSLYRDGVAGARRVLKAIAVAAHRLHTRGFHHKDLKPRNILLRCEGTEPELFFFDCPSGYHPPRFMLRRCIVRDLAHLEEGLRGHVRRVDLLYMYKQYRDCETLTQEDKALARDVLAYQENRRMSRKRRRREREKESKASG